MPVVVNNTQEIHRRELKSAPPDGYVVLRRMTFGEVVQRREMLKLSVASSKGSKDFRGEMAMASAEITRFEFSVSIIEHNLEREQGLKLNLSNPVDFAALDPRVGQEIEKYIAEINELDDEGE